MLTSHPNSRHGGQYRDGGTLAVTEELHAKQQEPRARKPSARPGRRRRTRLRMRRAKPGNQRPKSSAARSSRPPGRPAIGGRACRAQAGRPGDGTRWDTGTRRRRPAAQAGAAEGSAKSPNSPCRAPAARCRCAPRGTRAGRALQFPEPSLQEYERVRATYSPPLIPV